MTIAEGLGEELVHDVQFYGDDLLLAERAADFLAAGLTAGETAVVIATAAHRRAIADCLDARGHRTDTGRVSFRDADQLLATFMVEGRPDRQRFRASLTALLSAPTGDAPRVRAYGEMVDRLWQAGNRDGALALENLWTDLQQERSFSLLCSYALGGFAEGRGLPEISEAHRRVHVLDGDGADQAHRPTLLALTGEISRRKEAERVLRTALHELRCRELALEARTQRLERLVAITGAVADAVTPDEVFRAVINQVGTAIGASSAALWVVAEGSPVARLVRATGYSPTVQRQLGELPLDGTPSVPAADAIRQGRSLWFDSQEALLRAYPHLAQAVTPDRDYRVACLPVIARDRVVGALGFTFDQSGPLDDEARSLLMLVGRYAGQALDRLKLLDAEHAGHLQTEMLYSLVRTVISAGTLDQVFQEALDALERGLACDRASILVCDDHGIMRFRAWRGLSDPYRQAVDGHSPWPAGTHAPVPLVISDMETDPAMEAYRPLFRREGIGSLAFIPLLADGLLIGKFMVYYRQPRALSSQELELARAIADHVAAAISRFTAIARLQETVRFNEIFTGILGHDLRNPLAAMLMGSHLAVKRSRDPEMVRTLTRILGSGARMTRMIDQLLDFTRLRLNKGIPVKRTRFDLVPLMQEAIDELSVLHPGCTFHQEPRGDTRGEWDADRLAQVFSNLVANAVHHGDSDGGVLVTVDGTRADAVEIHVRNQGVIPAALLPKLFEPLTGRGSGRDGVQGLGLGLYITRQIVTAHGGHVAVQSDARSGTTFSVQLPRASTRSPDLPPR